jgi:DNA-binding XRE family transcriptional regulator
VYVFVSSIAQFSKDGKGQFGYMRRLRFGSDDMPKRSQNVPEEYTVYERAVAVAIGARIRQRRKALKLTQEQVRIRMEAESISVTQTQFSRIENGESLLNAAEVIALAVALGVSHHWLLDGKE